jgi:tetratricopeptide (TPR) repeat protein
MKNLLFTIKILIIFILLTIGKSVAQPNYLNEGIDLFKKNEFEKSKILFERNLVFDPRSEKSYLYLAKIFNEKKNDQSEETNLNSVLLLNPKNDEALYMLILLKMKQSDYDQAKILIDKFSLVCESFCIKNSELQNKLETMSPENAKNNN